MKPYFAKQFVVAGAAALLIPAGLFGQADKAKTDKKKNQQIIIMRNSDKDEKTVIEIKGDKVTVNGKDASESDDVQVHLNDMDGLYERALAHQDAERAFQFRAMDGQHNFNIDFDNDMALFSEDSNRAMLGVMTDEDEDGARITSITRESAAAKAGLKVGDVIFKINNDEVDDADDVSKIIRKHKPGDKVVVHIMRDGKKQTVTAELAKWKGVRINNLNASIAPMEPIAPMDPIRGYAWSNSGAPRLGLSVQDTDDGKGVKVLQVAEESNAAKAGVKKDDIITHINGEQVDGTDDVLRTMRAARNEASVKMQLLRDGKPQNIEVRIPRKLKTANL